jgi:hypothetical protein
MRTLVLSGLAAVALAPYAWAYAGAATLTITPDLPVYQVGDTITLNVSGDAEGAADNLIYGPLLFDADLANYVSSHQQPLTTNRFRWSVGSLSGGGGFAEAFSQTPGLEPDVPDGPLLASVTLRATAPGILEYSWRTDGDPGLRLDFFGLTEAPGGSVLIVPELSPGPLLGLGLIAIAMGRRSAQRR